MCSAKTLTNAWRFLASVLRENKVDPPNVTMPQIVPNEIPFLEPGQIKTFIKAVKGTDIEIPALLALSSLRRSEILALAWENVDLERRRVLVKGASVPDENNKMVYKKENKNRTSTRYVPIMIDELYNVLKREQGSGPVVSVHHETMRKRINAICAENSLPLVGVHGLRHPYVKPALKIFLVRA